MWSKYRIFQFIFLAIAFAELVNGNDSFGMRLTTGRPRSKESTQYLFRYFVKDDTTGDYKAQEETKEGDSVRGSYTIAEPNGDLRTVTYKAGPGRGFEARVDVQPSGSPMKSLSEATTTHLELANTDAKTVESDDPEKVATLESNVKNIPGGFIMDILSKPSTDKKTEMGVKFSLKTDPVTEFVPDDNDTFTFSREPETNAKVSHATTTFASDAMTDATVPTEGRDMSEDPIEREIDEAINSMPKLPEFVLSDNKTHLKFHKDPEEALLDERITQIARQLAETSLRREYEERKLGHFIPISVRPVEPSTSGYLSKSFKFSGKDLPDFRPSERSPLQLLTQVRVIPQYVYKQTDIPKLSSVNHRLPVLNRESLKTGPTYETIGNPPQMSKINKSSDQLISRIFKSGDQGFDSNYDAPDAEFYSVMPLRAPTFFQYYSPILRYVMERNLLPSQQEPAFYVGSLAGLTPAGIPLNEAPTFFTHVSMTNDNGDEKS